MFKIFNTKRKMYKVYALYSSNKLAGQPFVSEIINNETVSKFIYDKFGFEDIRGYAERFMKHCPSNIFEKMYYSYPMCTFEHNRTPPQLSFYDNDSLMTYHIVLIGDVCELRQSKGNHDRIHEPWVYIDKHSPVKDIKIIKRLETTFQSVVLINKIMKEEKTKLKNSFAKPLGEIFGIKSFPKSRETNEELLEYIDEKGHIAYIDWKLEYEDVLYNFNALMKNKGLSNKTPMKTTSSLCGEAAAREILSNFSCEGFQFVMIDVGTDGFYIAVLEQKTKDALESVLKVADFKYI